MSSISRSSWLASEPGRAWMICVAVLVMAVIHWLPDPAPLMRNGEPIALTQDGKACLAVLAFAITLWVTEAVPFAVTSLFVLLLVSALGIADYASVVEAGFGNPLITFFMVNRGGQPAG